MKRFILGIAATLFLVMPLALVAMASHIDTPHQTTNCSVGEGQFKLDVDEEEWEPSTPPGVSYEFIYSEEGEVIDVTVTGGVVVCSKVPQPDRGAGMSHFVIELIITDTTVVEEDTTTTTVIDDTTTTVDDVTTTTVEESTTTTSREETTTSESVDTTTTDVEETSTTTTVVTEEDTSSTSTTVSDDEQPVSEKELPFTGLPDWMVPAAMAMSLAGLVSVGLANRYLKGIEASE